MEYKKISVLIVTYRQADVIGRNIESILQQKEFGLHEIVICDDCSPDNNWDVIQEYAKKYPTIIRAYRNNPNLGIYGNSDKLVTLKGDADLFCWLEGDDALCDGFFKRAQDFINDNRIDISKKVALLSDFKTISPSGEVTAVFKNNFLDSHRGSPLGAKLRGLVSWRGSLFSKTVMDSFRPTILDKGLNLAETLFDIQFFKYVDTFYYIGGVGSIYFSSIGISTTLGSASPYQTTQALNKWEYVKDNITETPADVHWAICNLIRVKHMINPCIANIFPFIYHYFLAMYQYGFHWNQIRGVIKIIICSKKS